MSNTAVYTQKHTHWYSRSLVSSINSPLHRRSLLYQQYIYTGDSNVARLCLFTGDKHRPSACPHVQTTLWVISASLFHPVPTHNHRHPVITHLSSLICLFVYRSRAGCSKPKSERSRSSVRVSAGADFYSPIYCCVSAVAWLYHCRPKRCVLGFIQKNSGGGNCSSHYPQSHPTPTRPFCLHALTFI